MSESSMTWSEVANLTHAEQVDRFGFCLCEDGPKVYDDCHDPDTCDECASNEED